ncbi:MAG: MFS transporter, partial [Flavobacteriaceae bacterium]|nr:MFS transporter [Flavobacteriaceae bacterium]
LNPKMVKEQEKTETVKNPVSAYSDKAFWVFFIAMMIFGFVFLQYFSTIPLYYRDAHFLSETKIGLLMAMNGLVIAILEMPLVKYLEGTKLTKTALMIYGAILTALSLLVLNLSSWSGILIIGMSLMTIGEMITFPFSNTFSMQRAKRGHQGQYMAMYSVSFSIAHIFGHKLGADLIDSYGFEFTWYMFTGLMFVGVGFLYWLKLILKKENTNESKSSHLALNKS